LMETVRGRKRGRKGKGKRGRHPKLQVECGRMLLRITALDHLHKKGKDDRGRKGGRDRTGGKGGPA